MILFKRFFCYFFLISLSILEGCSDFQTRIADKLYFPLQTGSYQVYDVSETTYNNQVCDNISSTVSNYQLKVSVHDSVKNADGSYTYFIYRYKRASSADSWAQIDTWSAQVSSSQVIVNEGNVSYVKMVFPLRENLRWNGNQYNGLKEEKYLLINFGRSVQLSNGKKFASALKIIQSDNQDFYVEQDKRIELYAAGVGLVYYESTLLTYFQQPVSCYGKQKVQKGIIYIQSLNSYGHE